LIRAVVLIQVVVLVRRFALIVLGCLLSACSVLPPVAVDVPGRDVLRDFAVEARFTLRMEESDKAPQQASGRLSWTHQNGADSVMIANPLGYAVAEIDIGPQLSRLRSARGEVFEDADADLLMLKVTGYALPVSHLAGWLLGRTGAAGRVEHDAHGRPLVLHEATWQVDYAYADEAVAALPSRLKISQGNAVLVNLRIEEWRTVQ
jgi:outer membrane lipoprotein LolB